MQVNSSTRNSNLAIGSIITLVAAICIIADSFIVGKQEFFLALNADLGKWADYFFVFCTTLGDGAIWVGVAILFFFFQKKKFPLLITAIVVSTLIAQLTKNFVFPAEPRPIAAIANTSAIHTVTGVKVHTAFSFPSGHTATAFTIYLLACLLIKKKWIIPVGFVYALLVGYSRVYLAQHFPLDVGGGMITAVITIVAAVFVQNKWDKTRLNIE